MQKASVQQAVRLLGIAVLVALCAGTIGYSVRLARYALDGASTSEFTVTELSLTHSVERGPDGKLTNPYAVATSRPARPKRKIALTRVPKPAVKVSAPPKRPTENLKAKPAPSKPVSKTAAPKKPATKKPAHKKPAPKKRGNKPGKAKACPT